jgi:hypothetical protein
MDLTVSLTEPTDNLKIQFDGPPADYAPLRDAVRQLLQTRQAVLKATLTATYDQPLALSGERVQALAQAATDTGPSRCTVSLTTESDT